jgi:hypothetical protein
MHNRPDTGRRRDPWRPLLRAAGAAALLALVAPAAEARVKRIEVDQRVPAYDGVAVGEVGPYEWVIGRAFGELDPADRRNAAIQDIDLAPKNANGRVEYTATFSILKPVSAEAANGVLLYQVPNRGNRVDPGATRLYPGAIYLNSGWEGELLANCQDEYPCASLSAPYTPRPGLPAEVLEVPVARQPNGDPVTGPVLGRILNASGSTAQPIVFSRPLPYRPVTLETSQATLTSIGAETIEGTQNDVRTVPSGDWAWADCRTTAFPGTPDPTRICLREGFDPARLYQVVFTARDPLVLGIGFAATRDVVSFFARAGADERGTANPMANLVNWTIGQGTSQSGNFLKSLIHNGFTEDEEGRRVFDGAWPHIAARQNPLNFRFALPEGASTVYEPGSEPALWWGTYEDRVRGLPPSSLLDRCRASGTCPRIFETFGANEFWFLRMSPGLVGTDQRRDIPIPPNLRRYYYPGTGHGGGAGGFDPAPAAAAGCVLPANTNPESDQQRALLDALVAWIAENKEPPRSRYPRLAEGQLVPATREAMGFPQIPGLPFRDNLENPLLVYDFGPQFNYVDMSGVITRQPPGIAQVIPLRVVAVDGDGNEVDGVPSVQHQVPLGTYLGWNITASGFRQGQICGLSGGFVPFATTLAERRASGDPRPSLQERYGTHAGFVCAVTRAARREIARRFLRLDDAARLVAEAEASGVLVGVAAGDDDLTRAEQICIQAGG